MLLHAFEKYKEVPGQAKKKPDWPSKKATDAAVKLLKSQAAAAATAGGGGVGLVGEASPGRRLL